MEIFLFLRCTPGIHHKIRMVLPDKQTFFFFFYSKLSDDDGGDDDDWEQDFQLIKLISLL